MKIIYARQPLPDLPYDEPSIFLAGPTPKTKDVKSWRPEAISILEKLKFDGFVFVPEDDNYSPQFDYFHQVEWEKEGLEKAKCISFWIPRKRETLPGFTTNIEWGMWYDSGKVVLGYPDNATDMKYIRFYADLFNVPVSETLDETLQNALKLLKTTISKS